MKWFVALVAVGLGTVVLGALLHHCRPLLPTWSVRATVANAESTPVEADVYRMLGRPQNVFVRVPDELDVGLRWLVIRRDRRWVLSPNRPDTTPYLHFNEDMALGVAVNCAVKGDPNWRIDWSDQGVALRADDRRIDIHFDD